MVEKENNAKESYFSLMTEAITFYPQFETVADESVNQVKNLFCKTLVKFYLINN